MGFDSDLVDQKRTEVENLVRAALEEHGASAGLVGPVWESDVSAITLPLVDITPPELPVGVETIVLREDWTRGGEDVKPGNLRINLHKLIVAVASGALTMISVGAQPWLAPLAALVVWDSLWRGMKVPISERHACVIWTMWHHVEHDTVEKEGLLDRVNSERADYERGAISQRELDDALKDLVELGCIRTSGGDPTRWWLREWVQLEFR